MLTAPRFSCEFEAFNEIHVKLFCDSNAFDIIIKKRLVIMILWETISSSSASSAAAAACKKVSIVST